MTNWEKDKDKLKSWGILPIDNVPDKILNFLKTGHTINRHNHKLAGQIKNEFQYDKRPEYFDNFILEKTNDPFIKLQTNSISILSSSRPFYVEQLWINYQKKYEFNPMHTHSGIYSFIIFLNIPFDLKDEDEYFPKTSNSESVASRLSFILNDPLGNIKGIIANVDKSFEGKMLMFSSKMNHMVYPFYTSNEERITVSGNISFWVD